MSLSHSPKIVTNGLVLCLDAADKKSYPGTGTLWTDRSGNGINGTLTNGPTFSSGNGGSIVFDGGNDYVTLGTPSLLNGIQLPLTICMWAKVNFIGGAKTLWGVYSATTGGKIYSLLRIEGANLYYYASNSAGSYQTNATASFSTTANTWNFYAVTVSGTLSSPLVTLYLNNSFQTFSYGPLTSSPDLTVDFRIGSNSVGTEMWSGNIANAIWYNRALTPQEIKQNFNATRGRYGI